ncbi:MAG: 1-acyl-sn-glycerol-3-phosphate acyltransferase [Pseudomonadales bacterium]
MPDGRQFDDIRPYRDDETAAVLQRVIADNEFVDLLGQLRLPAMYKPLRLLARPLLRQWLKRRTGNMRCIADVQIAVEQYVTRVIAQSMSGFRVHGLSGLKLDAAHLYMSNHRDIALDPTLTNYALHHNGGNTLRVAIGDNLLSKPFVADLMRLNKSFVVRRKIAKPRELLRALGTLSQYIWHSLHVDRENVWIAHREGRAKDGFDRTEPAIIKMLTLAKPKSTAFAEYINCLGIVPVSISYEYDPCDAMKAREIRLLSETRNYQKQEHEDLASIGLGITGFKGRVDLVFGEPLVTAADSAEAVARELDAQIVRNYRLHATNALAYARLYGEQAWSKASAVLAASEPDNPIPTPVHSQAAEFNTRIDAMPAPDRDMALHMYANPVLHKLYFIDADAHPLPKDAP